MVGPSCAAPEGPMTATLRHLVLLALALLAACGPSVKNGNGNDDDPDGACKPGSVSECYDGQDGTAGVGACRKGTRTCTPQGAWGACQGQVLPATEACGDGVDNNCNGQV